MFDSIVTRLINSKTIYKCAIWSCHHESVLFLLLLSRRRAAQREENVWSHVNDLTDDQAGQLWEERVQLDMCTVFQLDLGALNQHSPSAGVSYRQEGAPEHYRTGSHLSLNLKNHKPSTSTHALKFSAALNSLNRLE